VRDTAVPAKVYDHLSCVSPHKEHSGARQSRSAHGTEKLPPRGSWHFRSPLPPAALARASHTSPRDHRGSSNNVTLCEELENVAGAEHRPRPYAVIRLAVRVETKNKTTMRALHPAPLELSSSWLAKGQM
ncbi:unnamed protein product, partial [Ectocarpus sp. 12 AP-2014]